MTHPPRIDRCRFAPTTSGAAHPGTLLAGLLCWLDARSRGAHLSLRLEDIDVTRCTPESADDMRAALSWLGLDWDAESTQSENRGAHEAALDELAASGALYPCTCTRSDVRSAGIRAADGGWRYPGTCRERPLPPGGWRESGDALRLRLAPGRVDVRDEDGADLGQDPTVEMGDPLLRRRDGAVAYHLAVVVDDRDQGITRVVRGRDLAPSTAIHDTLQVRLGAKRPSYRHHLLLLEDQGGKLAKLHGAIGWRELADRLAPSALCGRVAHLAGLLDAERAVTPGELVASFDWRHVSTDDVVFPL